MATLLQNQATFVQNQAAFLAQKAEADRRLAESERAIAERFARIEAILLEHSRILADHTQILTEFSRILQALPDAIREKIGFKVAEQASAHSEQSNLGLTKSVVRSWRTTDSAPRNFSRFPARIAV
jgi:hypothetical protein